jgi:hypothetical protein
MKREGQEKRKVKGRKEGGEGIKGRNKGGRLGSRDEEEGVKEMKKGKR